MRKTWIILKHEFLQTIKRKSYILLTLSLPILVVLGYGIYEGIQSRQQASLPTQVNIGYVDQAGGFDEFTTQPDSLFVPYASKAEAEDALLAEEIKEYFIIPADYVSTGSITRYTMERQIGVPDETWSRMKDFLVSNLLAGDVSPEVLERASNPMMVNSLRLNESGEVVPAESELQAFLLPIVFAFVFYFALIFSAQWMFHSVAEEKENRVIEILLSSVSPRQLLVGKVLGLGAAGIIQVAVWLITVRVFSLVASVNIPALSDLSVSSGLLAWAVVYFVLGYLVFAALYAGVGAIGNARDAQALSGIFILPTVMPMMLSFIILNHPEGAVARAFTFFPLSAPITAMMRLPNGAIYGWEIAVSLVILLGSVGLTMWIAAKVFRAFLLMYGKAPGLREIVGYVRQA